MAQQDKFVYFNIRARGEATRMLYVLANQQMSEEKLNFAEWSTLKEEVDTPLGQLPILTTKDGEGTLCQSTTISRYVAKKFGLVGEGLWTETLNDVIVETLHEFINGLLTKVLFWKLLKMKPEPENSKDLVEEIQLADVWLYTALEWAKPAFSDAMEITPWIKEFSANFESDPRIKNYLATRPETIV